MTKNCPVCKRPFEDAYSLYSHLISDHDCSKEQARAGSGWYEVGQPMGGDVIKAPEHVAAAARGQTRRDHPLTQPMKLSIPIVEIQKRREIQLPAGWTKAGDSYLFEQTLSEEHTAEDIILKKVVGKVTVGYGILELYTYKKELSDLATLQEKERILNNRLEGMCISDGGYLEIVRSLTILSPKIRAMKRDMRPEIDIETILQDTCKNYQSRDQLLEWQEGFMKKCLGETAQTKKTVTKTDPIPVLIEKHKAED